MAVLQALLFSMLAPLLPTFERELGLTKAQVGLLMGIYAIGQGAAALPMGVLAARVGLKRSALGAVLVFAASCVAFGLASTYEELLATRLIQGIAAAMCFSTGLAWLVGAAPRERRTEMIGVLGAARAAGQVIGPAVGAAAAAVGRASVFGGLAAGSLALAGAGALLPGPARGEPVSISSIGKAHRSRAIWASQWLVVLPGLLLGTVFVLAPLQLSRLGWGAAGIAGTFLVAATLGVVTRPLVGRWADRRDLHDALRVLLLSSLPLTLLLPWLHEPWLLALCVACSVAVYGSMLGPSAALVSQIYEAAGVAQIVAFALTGLSASVGHFVGSAIGAKIAQAAGDAVMYSLTAGICLLTVIVLSRPSGRPVEEVADPV